MFNNIAFDLFVGLVFIYLLYSLLATVLGELIATLIGLRARNLREAVDRMLRDDDNVDRHLWSRLWNSLKITRKVKSVMVDNFYNHPEIKYLGNTGLFRNPSAFKAISFSKTIVYLLSGEGAPDKAKIENRLRLLKDDPGKINNNEIILDKEAAAYVLSLWHESYGDVVKFKLRLETWFDRTMEQALEWYKRKIQVILMILGFIIAWFAGADTFLIAGKLSNDKDARAKIVELASAYIQSNPRPEEIRLTSGVDSANERADSARLAKLDSLKTKSLDEARLRRLDSLLEIKRQLEKDIADANSVLGIGGWLPDTIKYTADKQGNRIYFPEIDKRILQGMGKDSAESTPGKIGFTTLEKLGYFFRLFPLHFLGFLITAIAISLGAPFWYDLLNKLMKLRTAVKQPIKSPHNSTDTLRDGDVSPLNREA